MPEKHKGDIDFLYPKGYFEPTGAREPLQLYRVHEQEILCETAIESSAVNKNEFVFLFCLSGEGVLKSSSGTLPFSKDTAVMLASDRSVVIKNLSSVLRYICVRMSFFENCRDAEPTFSDLLQYFLCSQEMLAVENALDVKRFLSGFVAEICLPKPAVLVAKGLLHQTIITFGRHLMQSSHTASVAQPTENAVGYTVYAIIRYIDEHLYSMNNLASMAKDLGYSYNYLSHLFRRKTGMTIQAYVSQKKIERSKELLRQEDLSITVIASMLNYDCIQSFSKAFKRALNMSPTEYRTMVGVKHSEDALL